MSEISIRKLGLQDYEPVWRAMQRFTNDRSATSADEIWFCEHRSVFTLGLNAAREHLLAPHLALLIAVIADPCRVGGVAHSLLFWCS